MRIAVAASVLLLTTACAAPGAAAPRAASLRAAPGASAAVRAGLTRRAFGVRDVPFAGVLAEAQRTGKPALLLFRTDWCGYCKRLERNTLPDAQVRTAASAFTAVAYDAERGEGRTLATRYGVNGFPTLVLVDGAGNKIDDWAGYSEPRIYAAILRQMRPGG